MSDFLHVYALCGLGGRVGASLLAKNVSDHAGAAPGLKALPASSLPARLKDS
ncbi:hypothetical protein [Pseudomonas sp. OST1909]|uniref:hypothetical protein n=1 Tax=Pseudomonas sp. OST1909 TaxID=2777367 RepID=UPI001886D482|nr:hypothetical protein [Pseudomonas sp. OST1909]QOY73979.1 hypothetical protein IH404_13265 [Pseudomonas sp. OST1909]